jgi:hypothetical protein
MTRPSSGCLTSHSVDKRCTVAKPKELSHVTILGTRFRTSPQDATFWSSSGAMMASGRWAPLLQTEKRKVEAKEPQRSHRPRPPFPGIPSPLSKGGLDPLDKGGGGAG